MTLTLDMTSRVGSQREVVNDSMTPYVMLRLPWSYGAPPVIGTFD